MALSKETLKKMEDLAFKIGLCEMALTYKHYENCRFLDKKYYQNKIKDLTFDIQFLYNTGKSYHSISEEAFYDCQEEIDLLDT
jgi:hypothetical protein